MNRILILGASGFIGNVLYRELRSYFDTYGTFFTNKSYRNNHHLFNFNVETDELEPLLHQIKPNYVISALRGDFDAQLETHMQLVSYITKKACSVVFLSSANVFDAFVNYPSYEYDKTLSESIYGKLKIKIDNSLLKLPETKYIIARLPMVFGYNSPRIKELRKALEIRQPYEVFPNLVMNTTCVDKLARQIHYLINQKRRGIFHLGSKDLTHHDEFIKEIISELHIEKPSLKNVYTSNSDRYLAVLPKDNLLPEHLHVTNDEVIHNSCKAIL
ncbi:MAG: sugar nucleotide-binding protein [Bacteroidota bacterium]